MSSFNYKEQEYKIESRIVVALERVSEAFRVLLWNEGKDHSLSPIQVQILIFLLFQPAKRCTVSILAAEFNMTKATISDSVKVLVLKKFIKKTEGEDSRSQTIILTSAGKKIAEKVSLFTSAIEQPLNQLTAEQKSVMLYGLLRLISDLNTAGIITTQRMCFTCVQYSYQNGMHYCNLLQSQLKTGDLRIDCPEHTIIQ
jgi:DNA-binding MarR family transcriptional regulator